MIKILVTGVGGNVGQYIGNDLANEGYEVVGIYRNSKPGNANYKLVNVDVLNIRGGVLKTLMLLYILQQVYQGIQTH